jgi:probable HAF family extracellular repeat protein
MKPSVALIQLSMGFLDFCQVIRADAFTDVNGVFTTLNVPGGSGTLANGINDSGRIVGSFCDSNGRLHGFLDANAVFTTIDFPGAVDTSAFSINDAWQIVGFFSTSAGVGIPFLDAHGVFTILNVSAVGIGASATGINNSGQIVGYSSAVDGFLYANGVDSTIDVPGASGTTPWGINNLGQIVGQ